MRGSLPHRISPGMPLRIHLRTSATRPRISPVAACLLTALFFTPARISAQQPPTPPPSPQTAKPAPSPWPEIDALAEHVAPQLELLNLRTVFVVGAVGPKEMVSELNVELRDALSGSLVRHARNARVIDAVTLRSLFKESRISGDMLHSFALVDWMAIHAHADGFVAARVGRIQDGRLQLAAEIHTRKEEFKSVREFNCEVALTYPEIVASTLSYPPPGGTPIEEPGKNGVTNVECIECPRPEYTDEARRKKVEGIVVMRFTVRPDGYADDIFVTKSAGFGLDAAAVNTLLRSKFKPAEKDGHPVASQTHAEMSFLLF